MDKAPNFISKVERWKEMLREDKAIAEQYYYENIFEDVIKNFLSRSTQLKKYRFLISLIGFSPQPIILFIKAVQPERILFIYSEETELYLNMIVQWTGLNITQIEKERIDSSDVADVYRAIKKFIRAKSPEEILIDITGGKKSMVGGAVMVGNLLQIDTGYVDYEDYMPDIRQPKPGSEYPNILKNPLAVFGDIEIERVHEAFNHYNFDMGLDILSFLEDKIEDIWKVKILKKLTQLYKEVYNFDYFKGIQLAEEFIKRFSHRVDATLLGSVQNTLDILHILVEEKHPDYSTYTCLNFFYSGECFAERKRYDVAVFLMYRVVELILSFALKESSINPSNPQYPDGITEKSYNDKLQEVYLKEYHRKALPYKIGLMDSAIILSLLYHPLVKNLDVKKLKGVISTRNDSNFTHGMRPLTEEDFSRIRRMSIKLLDTYLNLRNKPNTVEHKNIFSFPKL